MALYNQPILELFSNLAWVSVTLTLFAAWLVALRRRRADSSLPGNALQMVAMVLLAVVLLPVISLSDDLQACGGPAELELLSRRAEPHASPDQPLPGVPLSFALPAGVWTAPRMVTLGTMTLRELSTPEVRGFSMSLAIRPPPAA